MRNRNLLAAAIAFCLLLVLLVLQTMNPGFDERDPDETMLEAMALGDTQEHGNWLDAGAKQAWSVHVQTSAQSRPIH